MGKGIDETSFLKGERALKMVACDLEKNPHIFRQKTAPGPSGILSEVQPSISSRVKPSQTSEAFDFPDFANPCFLL